MQTDQNVEIQLKMEIMKVKPTEGILCLLDKIFDYCDIYELKNIAL